METSTESAMESDQNTGPQLHQPSRSSAFTPGDIINEFKNSTSGNKNENERPSYRNGESRSDAAQRSSQRADHSATNSNDSKDEYDQSHKSRFRFKSKSKGDKDEYFHRHRHHRHRTKRRRVSPSLADFEPEPIDSDTAFRESLFDAMADDEGAAFWEGVYGQPIPQVPHVKEGPAGKLETMTDDEYVAYVRAEMYKKTHQHLLEEKERREAAKKERERLEKEARREDAESEHFRRKVEESLRRGRERKMKIQKGTEWAQRWKDYETSFEDLRIPSKTATWRVPWPVFKGVKEDLNKEEIESFFLNAPTSGKPEEADLPKILKAERVRWHPDKIQQKLGGHAVDENKMKGVTAVFQIIDRMWTEMRDGKT
jgi:hypothetical protein